MRVEYIGDATLYLGDCLEIMPTLGRVDAVITDPPYGMNYRHGYSYSNAKRVGTRHVNTAIIGDDKQFDPSPFLDFPTVILFGANHYANNLPVSKGWIFWDKRPNMKPNDHSDGELIWTNKGGHLKRFTYMWSGVCREGESGEKSLHPTQKPIALMAWLIKEYTKPGDTILDPFMGSGTTGVACANLDRKFIGIEIEEKYFDIACKRIEIAYSQPRLFDDLEDDKSKPVEQWLGFEEEL